ncbi:MAG: Na+/H+ antiporter [Chloroflexota bacterium]
MDQIIRIETLILGMLLIVSVVAIGVRRFRIPYTVALVLVGVALSLRSSVSLHLLPELILGLFVPPLVFEAAFHLNLDAVRRNLLTILLFAIPGVVLNMVLVGWVVMAGAGLPLSLALVFGALIAATDPVAVVALFRKLGVPKRLEVLLEGESLFNDGTAIVLFNLTLVGVISAGIDLGAAAVEFVRVAAGGVMVGLVLGWLVSRLIGRIDDYLVETTLTTVLAYGSYLVAEELHVSGVLAVVAAGLINGNLGPHGMSPTTRIVVLNFWEYVAFLANSAVFLLIGLEIDLPVLLANWRTILWAIFGVLASRAVVVYSLSWFGGHLPMKWRHMMYWGGLRGGIALALALSLPAALGTERSTITVMAFGVVFFTLVVQGLTLGSVVRGLGLVERSEAQIEYERRQGRALSSRAAHQHLNRLHRDGLLSAATWERLEPLLHNRSQALAEAVKESLRQAPELEAQEIDTARREALRASRSSLAGLRRDGVIGGDVYAELAAEIDAALETETELWTDLSEPPATPRITQLVLAVVQLRDLESAVNALAARGLRVTRIQTSGGFLGLGNSTLLVGLTEGKLEVAVQALAESCRSRVEYVPLPMVEASGVSPAPATPVRVRGATVFAVDVERYEEY